MTRKTCRSVSIPRWVSFVLVVGAVALMSLASACGGEEVAATTEAPPATTEAPLATTEAPPATTEAPPATTEAPAEVVKLGYIVKSEDNPYFVNQIALAKARAEELGVELQVVGVGLDANRALTAVDTLISAGIQGLAIVVPDQKIGPSVVTKTEAAGIPLIAVDDPITDESGQAVPFFGISDAFIGEQVGDAAADLYLESGWESDGSKVVRIVSFDVAEIDVCMTRTDASLAAFLKRVPSFPEDGILRVAHPDGGSLNGAIDVMATTITANPDVTNWIMWGCSDEGPLGATRALENAGFPADAAIGVGLGGHLSCDEFSKGKETSYRAAAALSGIEGAEAVRALHAFLVGGEPIPEEYAAPADIADRENYTSVIPNCG